jgi:MarR family transcriptional regulator, organic hydroperoxide resistance regulator
LWYLSYVIRNVLSTKYSSVVARGSEPKLREIWSLIFDLVLAHRGPYMARLAELGLTPPQATALRTLDPGRAVPMKELGERLACDPSTLTGIVDRLEARGLVERQTERDDRRAKVLVLTEEGRAVRAEAVNRMAEPPASLTTLSAADRRALRDILGRLTAEKIKAGGGPAGSRSRPVENAARRS